MERVSSISRALAKLIIRLVLITVRAVTAELVQTFDLKGKIGLEMALSVLPQSNSKHPTGRAGETGSTRHSRLTCATRSPHRPCLGRRDDRRQDRNLRDVNHRQGQCEQAKCHTTNND